MGCGCLAPQNVSARTPLAPLRISLGPCCGCPTGEGVEACKPDRRRGRGCVKLAAPEMERRVRTSYVRRRDQPWQLLREEIYRLHSSDAALPDSGGGREAWWSSVACTEEVGDGVREW